MEEWEEIDVWERELGPVCQTMSPEEIEYRTVLQKMRECLLMREVDNNLKAIIQDCAAKQMASIQADWNEYNKLVKDMKDIERRSEEEQLDKKKAVNEKTIKIVENLRLIEEIAASSENLQTQLNVLKADNIQQERKYAELRQEMNEAQRHKTILSQELNKILKKEVQVDEAILTNVSKIEQCELETGKLLAQQSRINNQIQQQRGTIRVYCRIRPFLKEPREETAIIEMTSESTIKINTPPNYYASEHHEKNNQFYFEEIFDQEYTQENIFDELRPLVMSAVDGKNVCIFAYGQTGSGKTYTMQGDASSQKDMGIIPRSIDLIFELVERARKYNWKYTVGVQIYENYLEKVENLLNNDLLKEHGDFDGSETIIVRDAEEAFWSFSTANRNRQVRSTNCNEHSSRSHLIFTIKMHAEKDGIIRDGSLSLIDLAGSQRIKLSQVSAESLKQTQFINKSLTQLGTVIAAMRKGDEFVPYRNSKLTMLLHKYLGGNSITLMLVNISPCVQDLPQTLVSLRFAESVRDTKVKRDI